MIDKHITKCYKNDGLFDASAFEKQTIAKEEKERLLCYLTSKSNVASASSGRIMDPFTNETVDNYCAVLYSDGLYDWTSRDIYCFEKHDMKLKEDFIKHALDRVEAA